MTTYRVVKIALITMLVLLAPQMGFADGADVLR